MPAAVGLAPPIIRPTLRRGDTADSHYIYLSRYGSQHNEKCKETGTSYDIQLNTQSPTDSSEDENKSARKGWGYQPINFGLLHCPSFKSSLVQLTLLGLVFCLDPGLGGGDLANPAPSNLDARLIFTTFMSIIFLQGFSPPSKPSLLVPAILTRSSNGVIYLLIPYDSRPRASCPATSEYKSRHRNVALTF